jgi:peptidoglycan/LPS O-acetylase OafA/YrhL
VWRTEQSESSPGVPATEVENQQELVNLTSRKASPPEIQPLTSLRGIAALVVLAYHLRGVTPTFLTMDRGYLGVDLFFILSGFVLTHVYGVQFRQDLRLPAISSFLWFRLARIYPLHFLTVVLVLAGASSVKVSPHLFEIGANLLFAEIPWYSTANLNPTAWSISAEWNAYLLFPLVVGSLLRCGTIVALVIFAVLSACMAATSIAMFDGSYCVFSGWPALIRSTTEFCCGISLYRLFTSQHINAAAGTDVAFGATIILIILAIYVGAPDCTIVALLSAHLITVASNQGVGAKLLRAKSMLWLGQISYSLYISQFVAFKIAALIIAVTTIVIAGERAPDLAIFLFSIMTALAFAQLLNRFVEVPSRKFLRELPRHFVPIKPIMNPSRLALLKNWTSPKIKGGAGHNPAQRSSRSTCRHGGRR